MDFAFERKSGGVPAAVGGLCAIAAGIGVGRFVYTPILPQMIGALGISKSQAGLIASANFLGYLIGALLAAMPTLPGSCRVWVLGALVASALTTAMMGVSDTMPVFLVLRLVGGIASAFVLILASTIVLEHLAELRRDGLSAIHFAGVGSGIGLSAAWLRRCCAPDNRGGPCGSRVAGWRLAAWWQQRRCCHIMTDRRLRAPSRGTRRSTRASSG